MPHEDHIYKAGNKTGACCRGAAGIQTGASIHHEYENWWATANNRVVNLNPQGCECERRIILHDVLAKVVTLPCL